MMCKSDNKLLASHQSITDIHFSVPFPISYGGFGTIISKAALEHLLRPIYCSRDYETCSRISQDLAGESSLFKDGMSIFQLFYKYSALESFCMHSDWLLGYILDHYLPKDTQEATPNLVGIKTYPSCGNYTITDGAVRPCVAHLESFCHNMAPNDMEALALNSYISHPGSFEDAPKLEGTDWTFVEDKLQMNDEKRG